MELRQLEYFMEVCKELHFTRAAENLNIAQPTLSQQIKHLESEVGVPLFDRIGKKTALTEAGRILLKHSQRIFFEMEQAQAAIRDLNGLQRGKLTVGALLTCANYLLPPVILNFKEQYPNIELSILGLRTGDIMKGILDNQLDLGVTFLPVENEELESVSLFTEELSLAVPSHHPLANEDKVDLKILEREQTILFPENYFLRQLIDSYCSEVGITLQPTLEMTTLESLTHMVAEGVGITVLPAPYLEYIKNDHIIAVKLKNPTPKREIGFVYRKDKFVCTATTTFIHQLIDTSRAIY